jgi:hypothetical protein
MNATQYEAVAEVLRDFHAWSGLPPRNYTGSVKLFARRMPPDMLLEAACIAMSYKPEGGDIGFRYFCGICHNMIRDRQKWLDRN